MSLLLEKEALISELTWVHICDESDLVANSGVCALLPIKGEDSTDSFKQIAIFYLPQHNRVFALSNWDPIGKANVIYRGIIGSIEDEPMVSSPLYKQHYSLISGQCFENPDERLLVFPCRIVGTKLEVFPESVSQK